MVLDTIYMITLPDNKGIIHNTIGKTAVESWKALDNLCNMDIMGTGVTRITLRKQGCRAKQVQVLLHKGEQ